MATSARSPLPLACLGLSAQKYTIFIFSNAAYYGSSTMITAIIGSANNVGSFLLIINAAKTMNITQIRIPVNIEVTSF